MEVINLFDISKGNYKSINDLNREQYRVKCDDNILNTCSFIHEFLNPGQNYKLFLDYDACEMNLNQCIEAIIEHLKFHKIPATESMIKVCTKVGENKFHFVIPSLYATLKEQKIFWQGLKIKIDFSVYRRGWFRMPNQKKPASNGKKISESTYQPMGQSELNDFILGDLKFFSKSITIYKQNGLKEIDLKKDDLKKDESFDTLDNSTNSSSLEGGFYNLDQDKKILILVHLLQNLAPEYYDDYSNWFQIGTIIKGALADEIGFELFDWFSKKSSKYPGRNYVFNEYIKWNEEKKTFGSFKFMIKPEIWNQALALGKVKFEFIEN